MTDETVSTPVQAQDDYGAQGGERRGAEYPWAALARVALVVGGGAFLLALFYYAGWLFTEAAR